MRPSAAQAIRAQLIAAMEMRAAALDGEARRVLDERLAALRAVAVDAPADTAAGDSAPEGATSPRRGPLGSLVDSIASDASPERAAYPELPALEDLRSVWSSIRADCQLQQSVAHTPVDAGPLNSAALVSRSIALMRGLSPGYLRSFLAYVDDLAWLEQMGGVEAPAASRTTATKRRLRKPRV